jgi:hypothetical protein
VVQLVVRNWIEMERKSRRPGEVARRVGASCSSSWSMERLSLVVVASSVAVFVVVREAFQRVRNAFEVCDV